MIVYRELSSLVADLGFSAKTLYGVSNRIWAHYHRIRIPKRDGGFRELCVPDRLLKAIQRQIHEKLLCLEAVSPYAAAYRPCGSTRVNAAPHTGKRVVLKLDIDRFFDHARDSLVKEYAFPAWRYSERNRVLLTLLCTNRGVLPQGAPTSPAISNLILCAFDMTVGAWCAQRGIAYTRYCDDMTFSGDFAPGEVIAAVRGELGRLGFRLNDSKTAIIRAGRRQLVTGLVVNERVHVPRSYVRELRQELYYCRRFGLRSHIEQRGLAIPPETYAAQLLGRIGYVLSVEPGQRALAEGRQWLLGEIGKAET